MNKLETSFLETIRNIVIINPFSDKYHLLAKRITQVPKNASASHVLSCIAKAAQDWIAQIESKYQYTLTLSKFEGKEKELLHSLFLLEGYGRYVDHFIDLIQKQLVNIEHTQEVKFGEEAIMYLESRGLSHSEALSRFALFYQISRAYHFIENSLFGSSQSMRELRYKLWSNIFTNSMVWYEKYLFGKMEDFSTLFLGETGTGKGAAASALGRSGYIPYDHKKHCFTESFTQTFLAINLSQYSEQLIESELFGHKKGAFTGAIEAYDGVLGQCSPNGAIFLDELGEVSMSIQIKLLQVLQERIYTPVGSHEHKRFSGRIIAATNKSLTELRQQGAIRDDFFYRLCSDVITVPPLRMRIQESPEELDLLIHITLQRLTGQKQPELFSIVKRSLYHGIPKEYHWPGNVRELEQAIRRVLLTKEYLGDRKYVAADLRTRLLNDFVEGNLPASEILGAYCALLYARYSTYEEVARRTMLDRRTVKKYIDYWKKRANTDTI